MKDDLILCCVLGLLGLEVAERVVRADPGGDSQTGAIRLVVQGDAMGSAHAANEVFIQCYKDGIMRTAEVMVPCPWFEEAARLCNENLDETTDLAKQNPEVTAELRQLIREFPSDADREWKSKN
jgi:hypothetical protein